MILLLPREMEVDIQDAEYLASKQQLTKLKETCLEVKKRA